MNKKATDSQQKITEAKPPINYSIKPMSYEDILIFREFRDRFKTWEQLKAERYLC